LVNIYTKSEELLTVSKSKPKVLLFGSMNPTDFGRSWIEQSIPKIEQIGWQPLPFDNLKYALEELDVSFSALATRVRDGSSDHSPDTSALLRRSDKDRLNIPRALIVLEVGQIDEAEYVRDGGQDIVIPGIFPEQVPDKLVSWLGSLVQEP
jgi:hypothetical protein